MKHPELLAVYKGINRFIKDEHPGCIGGFPTYYFDQDGHMLVGLIKKDFGFVEGIPAGEIDLPDFLDRTQKIYLHGRVYHLGAFCNGEETRTEDTHTLGVVVVYSGGGAVKELQFPSLPVHPTPQQLLRAIHISAQNLGFVSGFPTGFHRTDQAGNIHWGAVLLNQDAAKLVPVPLQLLEYIAEGRAAF